jgi:RHS repeat-associated protein
VGNPTGSDQTKIGKTTDRGYTDHINLEKSSLVHMNGRVYDAEIGRFLSPDPYVGNPYSTQGFNRYAYVQNNPLRYTDPSGFFCVGPDAILCVNVFASIASFLFGSDDEEPPPDFCKDNTVGCGGAAAGRLTENISLDFYLLPFYALSVGVDDSSDEDSSEDRPDDTKTIDPVENHDSLKLLRELVDLLNKIGEKFAQCHELRDTPVCLAHVAGWESLLQEDRREELVDCTEGGLAAVYCIRQTERQFQEARDMMQPGFDNFCGVTACYEEATQRWAATMERLRSINRPSPPQ